MRVRMHIGRDTILAMREVKRLAYSDPELVVQNGYLVGLALKHIDGRPVNWKAVANSVVPNVSDDTKTKVEGVQTTLNLETSVNAGIDRIHQEFREIYGKKRIQKGFVVKCILFAYILSQLDRLPLTRDCYRTDIVRMEGEPESMEELERSPEFLDYQDEYLDIIEESTEL